jgi:hypothetical protein
MSKPEKLRKSMKHFMSVTTVFFLEIVKFKNHDGCLTITTTLYRQFVQFLRFVELVAI